MRLGVLVNDIVTERSRYTTTAIMRTAAQRGHQVWVIGIADFVYDRGHVCAWAREASDAHDTPIEFMHEMRTTAELRRITVDDLDVLLLRNNPADDLVEKPWAAQIGLVFGEEAKRHGVLVLNDPDGLAHALSKLYLERFPEAMRPACLVTRHAEDVHAFAAEHGAAVVKPLNGSGGRSVFVIRDDDDENFNQIVEAVSTYGYLVVQEFLPKAREGDVRLLCLNGRPLFHDGMFAAMRRVSSGGDVRNNINAGGRVERVEVDAKMLELAELARPRLVEDGMWFVGLDIVEDKVIEVNVFTPGGLLGTSELYGCDFPTRVVEDLERKVEYAQRGRFENRLLACL